MRHFWNSLLVLLLISGCNCGGEELAQICPVPEPCFLPYGKENVERNILVGDRLDSYSEQVCKYGTTSCDKETFEVTCVGLEYAEIEICDGIDNDCNGFVDDGDHLIVSSINIQNPCKETELGVCKYSEARCVFGEWHCYPPADLFGEEVCDGKDNDCDGEIDEGIEQKFVYDGPPETLNIGECRAGVSYCENGQEQYHGMVTPILEICGNEDDDDCDGFVDERENQPLSFDFALLIDFSGSMNIFIQSVGAALCQWSADSTFANSRFAIIGIAADNELPGIRLVTDFTDAGSACNALTNFVSNYYSSIGTEYQVDAILLAGESNDWLDISWSDRTRKIIVFSDEEVQYSDEFQNATWSDIINSMQISCTNNNYTVSAFTSFTWPTNPEWSQITSACGGYLEYLSYDHNNMIEKLNYWFGEEC